AVVRRADDLYSDVEVGRLLPVALVLHLRVRLGHLAVELVTLHGGEVAVREVIVAVDRVPFTGEVLHAPLARFLAAVGARDVGQDDRRPRRVTDAARDVAVALDVLGGLGPLVLHDDQYAEAELGHDLGRLRAHRRRVEPPLGMRDGPRADRRPGNLEVFAVPVERVVRQRLDHDLRRLDEAWPRLFHGDAEAGVLDARGAAPVSNN